jgi:hypothetical protein
LPVKVPPATTTVVAEIAPPNAAVFAVPTLFALKALVVAVTVPSARIAPPRFVSATFPVKVPSVTETSLFDQIAPPSALARLPVKVDPRTVVRVGLPFDAVWIAPPSPPAVLSVNVLAVTSIRVDTAPPLSIEKAWSAPPRPVDEFREKSDESTRIVAVRAFTRIAPPP